MVALSPFEACQIGDIETVKKLPHINPKLVDNNGASCLHYAARGGSLSVVEYLVQTKNFPALERTKTGATALHDAASKGRTCIVEWLLKNGDLHVNVPDNAGLTALHLAALYSHFETIEWLLDEANADVSLRTNDGALPLHLAVVGGDMKCVKILVEENPRLINMQMNNGAAPVYLASQAGHLDILKYLINSKAATKVKAYDAMSCLHAAAQMGHLNVVKWLVTVDKSNPNDRDFDGITPLHFAAGRGHADVVRWLLKQGGARITLDNLGGSPLHTAAEMGELKSIQALLDCGCDVTLTDNAGLTAAELADNCGQTQAAALIRGEVWPSELGQDSSNQSFPGRKPSAVSNTSSLSSPSLPSPPTQVLSRSSTPRSLDSPISPPTPLYEDNFIHKLPQGLTNNRHQAPFNRTNSRLSVDSSASNFGVFEQPDAVVVHTVRVEVHSVPKFVPPTPKPVSAPSLPGQASQNSTQESLVFSTSSSSFSQDESFHTPASKLSGLVKSLDNVDGAQKVPKYSLISLTSPPLAHSTLSFKKDLRPNDGLDLKEAHNDSKLIRTNSHNNSESEDSLSNIKFQYYSTPYKKDFNTGTKSSFAKAKALFQSIQTKDPSHICPDSGEVCTSREIENHILDLSISPSPHKMEPPKDKQHSTSNPKIPATSSVLHSPNTIMQTGAKSIVTIQGHQVSMNGKGAKPNPEESNKNISVISTTSPSRIAQINSSNVNQSNSILQEIKSRNISQPATVTQVPINGHMNGLTTAASQAAQHHPSASAGSHHPSHLTNGADYKQETNSRSISRSSSSSSTSSQPFRPVESKHNLIADIQSAVSGASTLSLRRTKGKGEGVSMVYQSKKGVVTPEVKASNQPLSGQFDPKNFLDKVEMVDSTGRAIPEWRRHVLAKHLAEKAHKEYEDKKSAEEYEARFQNVPAWKRALIERKEASAREDAASINLK